MVSWLRMAIILLLIFGFITPIIAESGENEKDEVDCNNAMSTPDLTICAIRDYERADKELNEVYQKLIADHKQNVQEEEIKRKAAENSEGQWLNYPHYKLSLESLRQSQRDWIKFRDGFCDYATSLWMNGTGANFVYPSCLATLTIEQTERLRDYLNE